ncbi:MAG: DoxX family protein [Acetobacteraceae bacterium]
MQVRDAEILLGRILLAVLFLPGGIEKALGWPGIVHAIAAHGAPLPLLGGIIALICELLVTALILFGVAVKPLAVILAIYTMGAAFIAHRYWQMAPPASIIAHVNFYKNVAIAGGLLGLSAAGAGRLALWRNS